MLLLRGGVPRRNSFPTVVGEQPSSLAMALFESPCRLRYWIAPLSSRPRCCPFLRSAATVIYCVQSIVIALLLVNVVWELHSTIRVKSLWIFFSQVSNFIMQSTVFFYGIYRNFLNQRCCSNKKRFFVLLDRSLQKPVCQSPPSPV